jgi:hypothetical protein
MWFLEEQNTHGPGGMFRAASIDRTFCRQLAYNASDMTPEDAQALEPTSTGMSEIARISGIFFEPKKTFEDIAKRPSWLLPLVLVILSAMAATFAISQRIGWEQIARQQIESSSRAQQLTAEQKEQQVQMGAKMGPLFGYVLPLVGAPLVDLIIAGVLLGIAAGIMSAGIRFKQVFSVICWAGLPGVIKAVLMIVVIYLKNPEDFNLKNPLAFNAGAFLDPTTASKFLYSIASSIDVFTIWIILLIATGLKAAAGKKLSFSGALTAVVLPWVLWVFGAAALAGAFG